MIGSLSRVSYVVIVRVNLNATWGLLKADKLKTIRSLSRVDFVRTHCACQFKRSTRPTEGSALVPVKTATMEIREQGICQTATCFGEPEVRKLLQVYIVHTVPMLGHILKGQLS